MSTPVLVIGVISESARTKDAIKKLGLYMPTGISEYWIINSQANSYK